MEFTGDFTSAESVLPAHQKNGKNRTSFIPGYEAELNHLQLGTAQAGSSNVGSNLGTARLEYSKDEQSQKAWAEKLSNKATLTVHLINWPKKKR